MTPIELAIAAGSVAFAAAGIAVVLHAVATAGRDSVADSERLAQVVETAPYERLDNVLSTRK